MKSSLLEIVAIISVSALWEPARPHSTKLTLTDEICKDMTPDHHLNDRNQTRLPSKNLIAFNYTDPLCYTPGKTLNVTILRAEIEGGKDVINGIMVQANKPDVNTVNFGTFEVRNTDKFIASECWTRPKSVLSHITKLNQSTITFYWLAPSSDEGDLQFRITLVFTYKELTVGLEIPLPICKHITQQLGTTATINNPGLSYFFLLHLLNFFRH